MNFTDLDAFQKEFNGFWVGVNFYHQIPVDLGRKSFPLMRLCQAVTQSKSEPIFITPDVLDCPGARLSLGWGGEYLEGRVITDMAEKRHITEQRVRDMVKEAPRLQERIKMVGFQTSSEPDVLINYALPSAVMKLLFSLQNLDGESYYPEISRIATVCGGVAVEAYLSGQVCRDADCVRPSVHSRRLNYGRGRQW
jgi:uncharacterized protein (DUF169 family)